MAKCLEQKPTSVAAAPFTVTSVIVWTANRARQQYGEMKTLIVTCLLLLNALLPTFVVARRSEVDELDTPRHWTLADHYDERNTQFSSMKNLLQ